MNASAASARSRFTAALLVLSLVLCVAGLAAGGDGWSPLQTLSLMQGPDARLLIGEIRAPRTVGAWLTGALLGLAGALAQGLFRNPLADPYLLGSASGAVLGVVTVLAGTAVAGYGLGLGSASIGLGLGLAGAAFVGALVGVMLTLALARSAHDTTRLLLAGVVVGVLLGALSDLVTTVAPQTLRGKQAFLLGSTGFLGWRSCLYLAIGLAVGLPVAWRMATVMDALTLGDESASSLGIDLPRWRALLVSVMALATGLAVSQAGLIAFVGLVSPHLVRRFAPGPHGHAVLASAAVGGVLLTGADLLARTLVAPQELPVGVLTAVLGGGYLLWLLNRRGAA